MRTALEIIDEVGIEGFCLEPLALRLGVKAPSLYHHFTGKKEILSEVAALITFGAVVPPEPPIDEWQTWFVDISASFRRSVLLHPRAAPLVLQCFPRGFTLSTYERAARVLSRAGIPSELHVMILEGLDMLAFGSALFAAARLVSGRDGLFPTLDPDRNPVLSTAIETNRWPNDEDLFSASVRCFLEGVVALRST